jgi:hypothetical protein
MPMGVLPKWIVACLRKEFHAEIIIFHVEATIFHEES